MDTISTSSRYGLNTRSCVLPVGSRQINYPGEVSAVSCSGRLIKQRLHSKPKPTTLIGAQGTTQDNNDVMGLNISRMDMHSNIFNKSNPRANNELTETSNTTLLNKAISAKAISARRLTQDQATARAGDR